MSRLSPYSLVKRAITRFKKHPQYTQTRITDPDSYFKMVWLDRVTYRAVAFMAGTLGVSKKQMVRELIMEGLGRRLGNELMKSNAQEKQQRAEGRTVRPTRFVYALRRWAKEEGLNVDKYF
jgi:hypothetical protein